MTARRDPMPTSVGPCYECPDRKRACSDYCQNPEFLAKKERAKQIKAGRAKYNRGIGVTIESCYRNPWYGRKKR